ncbi:MAG: tRNA 2-selenouridine(34) synthase MnmH [Bacteroidota bacterium]|jgi:tRNA 2-selenouridine synthase
MAVTKLEIAEFIKYSLEYPVLDVRSEGEFKHAHIPKAFNLPLFNDAERVVVGKTYKQQSREAAIKKGLDYFGPKMKSMILFTEKVIETTNPNNKTVLVHCWRGGMRSAGVAWLLDLYGFKVFTLIGGYKSYRSWVLQQFEKDWNLNILGGYTGSGKTIILEQLKNNGEAVIDLEGIAGHRGSAFGRIGLPEQTSVEMFENNLALQLYQVSKKYPDKNIWMEDESQRIGAVSIPHALWTTMRKSLVYFINIPFKKRLAYLADTYGIFDKLSLAEAINRIQKRLGGLETKTAIEHLESGAIEQCFDILLKYYDKQYLKSLQTRKGIHVSEYSDISLGSKYKIEIICDEVDSNNNANKILKVFYGRN